MPLLEFLNSPDWNGELELSRWRQLTPNPNETEQMQQKTDEKSLATKEQIEIEDFPFTTREEALAALEMVHS